MAKSIPRPCKHCSALTTDGTPYCDAHKGERYGWKQWQQRKGTRHQRGYGATWERLRRVVIQRDSGLCQECLKHEDLTQGSDVDHITPKSQGGTDALDNLQLLCKSCHKRKTTDENRGRGAKIST